MSTTNLIWSVRPDSDVPVTNISWEVLLEDIGRPMSR